MSSYYKATRPDGTDFYTGTVDYGAALASGDTIRLDSDETEFPGPGWLHLATVPTECDGMTWPCRLFEVEPVGEFHRGEGHPHKIGCREVRVLRELPAHEAFGPQGEQVAALIERARCLTAAEIKRLHAAWYAARAAARAAARYAAWDAARAAARYAAWDAAWDARRGVVRGEGRGGDAAGDAAGYAAGYAAGDAAGYAAWSLVARDLISTDAYDTLTRPWGEVIGPIHPDDPDMRRGA
jgi:hypothetical protein